MVIMLKRKKYFAFHTASVATIVRPRSHMPPVSACRQRRLFRRALPQNKSLPYASESPNASNMTVTPPSPPFKPVSSLPGPLLPSIVPLAQFRLAGMHGQPRRLVCTCQCNPTTVLLLPPNSYAVHIAQPVGCAALLAVASNFT